MTETVIKTSMQARPARQERRYRRRLLGYAVAFALVVATIVGAVGGMNFLVDVNDVFQHGNRLSDKVVRTYVAAARSAEIGVAFGEDDRPVKRLIGAESTADCIILGSSSVMMFRRDGNKVIASECTSLDNLSLISASFEDVLTMLGVAAQNPNVHHIFVGIDAFTFQRKMHKKWRKNMGAFMDARHLFGLPTEIYSEASSTAMDDLFSQAFSFQYFADNFRALKRILKGKRKDFDPTPLSADDLPQIMVLRSDGSMGLPAEFKPTPPDAELGNGPTRIKEQFIDPSVYQEMQTALKKVVAMGKDLTVVIPPLHPKVFQCLAPLVCDSLKEVEPAIRRLASDAGADLIGGFNPVQFGLTRTDFIDDRHMRAEAVSHLTVTLTKSK